VNSGAPEGSAVPLVAQEYRNSLRIDMVSINDLITIGVHLYSAE